MKYTKSDLNWIINKMEQYSERYMEAERFILELAKMKWYQRMFCFNKIIKFLESRNKYKF